MNDMLSSFIPIQQNKNGCNCISPIIQQQQQQQQQQRQQNQKQSQKKPNRKPSLKLKMSIFGKMPSIEVTTPTPSPTEEEKNPSPTDEFFTFAHETHKARVDNPAPHMTLQD